MGKISESSRYLLNWLSTRVARSETTGKLILRDGHESETGLVRRRVALAKRRGLEVVPDRFLPPPFEFHAERDERRRAKLRAERAESAD